MYISIAKKTILEKIFLKICSILRLFEKVLAQLYFVCYNESEIVIERSIKDGKINW